MRGSAANGFIPVPVTFLRGTFGFSSISDKASCGGCFSKGATGAGAAFSTVGEDFPVMRWIPATRLVGASDSAGRGSEAADLAWLTRLDAVFWEDSSAPVLAELAMPVRVVERFGARALSASVGVLERVVRVAIQLVLVLGSSPALDVVA